MEVTSLCIFYLLPLLLLKTRFLEFGCYLCKFYQNYPLSRNGQFVPFLYTENAANIYELLFFLHSDISFIFVVFNKEKCMFDVKIK